MSGTYAEEMASLRREIVELYESADGFSGWIVKRQAREMWRQLDRAERVVQDARDNALREWGIIP